MFVKYFFIALILLVTTITASPVQSSGEFNTANNNFRLNKEYWKGYVSNTKEIFTSPTRWEKSDWMKFSLIAGITAGLYAGDQEIQDWVQDNRSNTSDSISSFFEIFGDATYTLPPLAGLYAYGHYYEHEKARKVALLSMESYVITCIFTVTLKISAHRHRPSSGDPYNTWDGPGLFAQNLSFPSGHSSSVFSIATVIATEYKDNVLVPPVAYGIAALSALSRVHDNAHWASDVFFGSTLGYLTAKAVVGLHDSNKNGGRLSIYPVTNSRYSALMVSYKF